MGAILKQKAPQMGSNKIITLFSLVEAKNAMTRELRLTVLS